MVELREVVCVFGSFPALAGADFSLDRGEIVHLVGPNGAGKTTLLRVLAGLLAPLRGQGHSLGHDLMSATGRRKARSEVSFVAGEPLAYEDLTVEENLRFLSHGARSDASHAVMDQFGLLPLRAKRAGHCSTGQRKRLGLAAGFARAAELILLDEPHAGLDAHGRALLDGAILEELSLGHSVVIVSHDHEQAAAIATRTCEVDGGVIRESS